MFNYFRPVLITDAMNEWKANKWNKEFFVENYGDQQVVMKAVDVSIVLCFKFIERDYMLHVT